MANEYSIKIKDRGVNVSFSKIYVGEIFLIKYDFGTITTYLLKGKIYKENLGNLTDEEAEKIREFLNGLDKNKPQTLIL